jgi:hypothetical protein
MVRLDTIISFNPTQGCLSIYPLKHVREWEDVSCFLMTPYVKREANFLL